MHIASAFDYLNNHAVLSVNISDPSTSISNELFINNYDKFPESSYPQNSDKIFRQVFKKSESRFQSNSRNQQQAQTIFASNSNQLFAAERKCLRLIPYKSSTFKVNPHNSCYPC